MRALFVMDPVELLHIEGDSTYAVMREHTRRGWDVAWCTPGDLSVLDGVARAAVVRGRVEETAPHFVETGREQAPLGAFDVVWMRKDPPFDMRYIFATYILDLAPRSVLVINDPVGLKRFNEKLWAMAFADLQPSTLLSRDAKELRSFVEAQPEGAVLKPWDGNGGRGVFVTRRGDRNLGAMIETLTAAGRDFVIAQAYLPGVAEGDKRILIFDGEPVGAVLRVPQAADHRANLHVGALAEPTSLSDADRHICDRLRPHLKEHGQVFVGIDVIQGKLTEINVTSPTGLREVHRLTGRELWVDLVDVVAAKHAAR